MRTLGLALVLALPSLALAQTDVAPMPDAHGLDAAAASGCARGDADRCVTAGDGALRGGDGARANAFYRRGADLARRALHVPARTSATARIHSIRAAIASLEANWDVAVVRGAALHGQRAFATSAHAQLFGASAVAQWSVRTARIDDAFAAVHTWTHREGGAFASGVWIGDLRALAADGPCFELVFAYMNLDFTAYLDELGHVLAIVHLPEG